jgi:hypothetical protein
MKFSVKEMLIQMKMVETGIVPYDIAHQQILEALSSLSPDQQRVVKRKFRKMWRKAYRSPLQGSQLHRQMRARDRGTAPTRIETNRRRWAVYHMIEQSVLNDNDSE